MNQYHSKRKSTFEKETFNTEKSKKADESSSSFKALNIGYDLS